MVIYLSAGQKHTSCSVGTLVPLLDVAFPLERFANVKGVRRVGVRRWMPLGSDDRVWPAKLRQVKVGLADPNMITLEGRCG